MIKTAWSEHFEGKITRKQQRLRRISEIAHDVMPAGCGRTWSRARHHNHQPSQQEKHRDCNGVVGGQ